MHLVTVETFSNGNVLYNALYLPTSKLTKKDIFKVQNMKKHFILILFKVAQSNITIYIHLVKYRLINNNVLQDT